MSGLTPEQKQAAIDYVERKHCWPSDNEIETDATPDSPDAMFSPGEDGVWVQTWIHCPKEHIPNYGG